MKSIQLYVSAMLLTLNLTGQSWGQENANSILARGHAAALPVDAVEGPRQSRFPAFMPAAGKPASGGGNPDGEVESNELAGPAVTVTSSLVLVLGLFAGLVWLTRRFHSRGSNNGLIPKEVLQNLGSANIDPRTKITMIRCGNRILVIAMSASGVHPLSEITDPDEIRELSAACLGDSKRAFASALKSIEQEKSEAGYLGSQSSPSKTGASGRLFATA